MPSSTPASGSKMNLRSMLLGLIPSILIDAGLPFLVYTLLRPHTSELIALIASTIPPMASNIVSLIRTRKLDAFGIIILLGIVISIIAIFLGGDTHILLIRESLVTVGLGIACIVSLLLPRPLMFYISRHFVAAGSAEKAANYDSLWQYPIFRKMNYRITIAWGIAFIAEFCLKVYLVYTLSIPQVLVISPIIFNTLTVGLIVLTMLYGTRVARQDRQRREARAAAQTTEATQ